jgi:hypothetical protein
MSFCHTGTYIMTPSHAVPANESNHSAARIAAGAILLLAALGVRAADPTPPLESNSTDGPMFFHSYVFDHPACAMTLSEGAPAFADGISNPAATCPDAFGWAQFMQAVRAEFWTQWANDETVWVAEPKPLCDAQSTTDCCRVDEAPGARPTVAYIGEDGRPVKPRPVGGPGKHCPYIPGEWARDQETTFQGGKALSSHTNAFLRSISPARIARQQEVEIIYRNDAFVRYTAKHDLYSQRGLKALYARGAGQARHSAPYRPLGQGVAYPPEAVMFKVDWVKQATMVELGYVSDHDGDPSTPPNDPTNPYITMQIKVSTDGGKHYEEGMYYLAAITGASKALPNWHWYAFEHVNNLGRCDFVGCNDSFGYTTTVTYTTPDGKGTASYQSNFIRPHTQPDDLPIDDAQKSVIYDLGKPYASGTATPALDAIYSAMGFAADPATPVNPAMPSTTDPAWRSYRLKGTQTAYYTNDGYPTVLGASITEGGFVNTASCMSCHVQSSVGPEGSLPPATGVGATGRLSLDGIGTVVRGAPYIGDYYVRGSTQTHAIQVDFVWGILNAQ